MSSILDALNKLEEERNRQKQAAEQTSEEDNPPFEPDEAAAKLLRYMPPSRKAPGKPKRVKTTAPSHLPRWVTMIVSLLALAAVVSSAGTMVLVYRMLQNEPPLQAYTVPVVVEKPAESVPGTLSRVAEEPRKPEPITANTGSKKSAVRTEQSLTEPVVIPSAPMAESVRPTGSPPAVDRTASALAAQESTLAPAIPALADQAASDEPVKVARDGLPPPMGLPGNPPVVPPPALPSNPPAVLSTAATRTGRTSPVRRSVGFMEPDAVNALPRLTLADQERYGLGELRLNVLREAGPGNPDPVAIINLKKVYLGEQIPGTRARLVGISSRAIAIEIEGTEARYRVSR